VLYGRFIPLGANEGLSSILNLVLELHRVLGPDVQITRGMFRKFSHLALDTPVSLSSSSRRRRL